MSITLDDTWGGGSANVYITLADADALLTFQVLDAQPWTDAEVTPRNAALLTATRQIDSYNWAGGRYFYRQALLFPRVPSGNIWPYGPYYGAAEASPSFSDFIEQDEYLKRQKTRVKRACALQALWLLRQPSGRNLEREAQVQGISAHSSGKAGISESQSFGASAHRLCSEALDELRQYRSVPKLVRGSGPDLTFFD